MIKTPNFSTQQAAILYHRGLGLTRLQVQQQINSGGILIGKPETKPEEKLFKHTETGIYYIK